MEKAILGILHTVGGSPRTETPGFIISLFLLTLATLLLYAVRVSEYFLGEDNLLIVYASLFYPAAPKMTTGQKVNTFT